MSAYPLAARAPGAEVSGAAAPDAPDPERARAAGIPVTVGHNAANLPAGDDVEVVHSTAIPEANPERVAARERGLPDRSRADLLAELTRLRKVIAIAGAHGKTTTASMIAHALLGCGMDPGYLIGGELSTTGTNGAWGTGEWLVVEADESDRSMLALDVDIAVLTNVDLDHHVTYGSLAELEEAFQAFLEGARERVVAPEIEGLELLPGGSRFVAE